MAERVEQRIELRRLGAERRRRAGRSARPPALASGPSASAPPQSPAGSRDWPARSAPGPAPGSRWSATSIGPTRSRRRRTAPGATGRAFRPARTPRRRAIIEMPRIMLLQIFAAWPAPASPQWTMRPAIGLRMGSALAKASAAAAGHEGQGAGGGAAGAARDRRVDRRAGRAWPQSACAFRADSTSMVEESMNSAPLRRLRRRCPRRPTAHACRPAAW